MSGGGDQHGGQPRLEDYICSCHAGAAGWGRSTHESKEDKLQSVNEPPEIRPDAAGIDISPEVIYEAVDPRRDPQPIRHYGTVTAELYRIANWLKACCVRTVAMESTGVYWIPLCQVLDERGFEVYLVNARH